jgi:hypothetical protein
VNLKDQITKIKDVLFYVVPFMLACYIYATPLVICLFVVSWVAEGNLIGKFKIALGNKFTWLFCSFYLLYLIGMLYTANKPSGWFELEVNASLFIFPLILASEGKMDFSRQKKAILAFTAGLIINGFIYWLCFVAIVDL